MKALVSLVLSSSLLARQIAEYDNEERKTIPNYSYLRDTFKKTKNKYIGRSNSILDDIPNVKIL